MSKIGDYVHYHAKNYLQYGTSQRNAEQAVSKEFWIKVKQDMRAKVTAQRYNNADIKKIQDQYNHYRKVVTSSKKMQPIRDKILELLLKKSSVDKNSMEINWDAGGIQLANDSQIKNQIEALKKMKGQHQVPHDISHARLTKTVKNFINFYKDKLSTIKEVDRIEHISQVLKEADSVLEDMTKAHNDYIREHRKNLQGIAVSEEILAKETADQIIKSVQQAFAMESIGAVANLIGNFEEYIAAAVNLAAQGLSLKTILSSIQEGISQGGARITKGTIQSDLVELDQELAKELNSSFTKKDENGEYIYKTSYNSQSKVDAVFTAKLNKKLENTKLSIKNYNLSSSRAVSLVTNSPLSTFLFNMGDVNLTNHFLNIFAAHPDISEVSLFSECRKEAETSLAYYLLWAAISGKGTGKEEDSVADIFVVNDNKSDTGVKMWDIGSLVQTIVNKSELNNSLIIAPALNMISLENSYGKGEAIQKRLSRLIINTHAIKIKVAISASVLR